MKVQLDIVTGLLGAGKTTLINRFAAAGAVEPGAVILQCEKGMTEPDVSKSVVLAQRAENETNTAALQRILRESRPRRIIIEANGMESVTALMRQLQSRELWGIFRIRRIFFVAACAAFPYEYRSYTEMIGEQISQADVVILTGSDSCSRDTLQSVKEIFSSCGTQADLFDADSENSFQNVLLMHGKPAEKHKHKLTDYGVIVLAVFFLLYLLFEILRSVSIPMIQIPDLQTLNTVFLSILFEAFPFILIGVFVSSLIQVLIPSHIIERAFTRNLPLGFLAALFAGIVFPVCDCATVPVTARLIKKGAPPAIAVTFLLAAPLVNPIVVISTFCAFPGYPIVAFCRIAVGLLIALLVGLSFLWGSSGRRSMATAAFGAASCGCAICAGSAPLHGFRAKADAVLNHAANEFFGVGIYLIAGALISSILQVYLPKSIWSVFGSRAALAVAAMMGAAFILSVCSTSDAFIARTFANSIPIASVMAFMILGPMLDFKNLMLLIGNFKKRFVLRLVMTICAFSFLLLLVLPRLFFQ